MESSNFESSTQAGTFSTGGSNVKLETLEKVMLSAQLSIDKKAEHVKILDLTNHSGFTEFFMICSAQSDRQVQAISNSIEHELGLQGIDCLSIEGYSEGRWVLLDFGDFVVHIFLEALRDYYNLEVLWSDAPLVKIPSEFYGQSAIRMN